MLGSIFLAMSLDFATLTSVKKVRNLQHENLPIQDINFPTKNSKSPDLGSRMYHMYAGGTILLYNNSTKRICTDRDLTMSYFATPSLLSTKNGDFSGENTVNTWVLQLAVGVRTGTRFISNTGF